MTKRIGRILIYIIASPLLVVAALLLMPGVAYYQYELNRGRMGPGTVASLTTTLGAAMVFWVVMIAPTIYFVNIWMQRP